MSGKVTTIQGADLAEVVRALATRSKAGRLTSLRVMQTVDGQVKISVNQGCWGPAMGTDTTG